MRSALAAQNIIFIKENLLNYRANRNGSLLTKRAHYIDNVIKDTKWANSLDIDKEVKAEILDYIYELLVMNCLDAYYVNVLKYKQMRKIFKENIDMDVFSVPLARKLTEKFYHTAVSNSFYHIVQDDLSGNIFQSLQKII